MKTLLTSMILLGALCVGEAQAGRNAWTNRIYRGESTDGCQVRCRYGSCSHGCQRLTVTLHGIRYDVRVRVVQASQKGLGLKVTVKARVVDGQTHGFDTALKLVGQEFYLPPHGPGRAPLMLALGFRGWSHPPTMGPGKTATIRDDYNLKYGVDRGYRLVLPIRMYHVIPPGWKQTIQPLLGTVVLTVPYRGTPRVRLR
jgi:hypothetical protein